MHCTLSIHYTVNITNVKNSDMHGAHAMHAPAEGWDDETLSDSATGATVKEAEGQKAHEKSTPLKSRRISTPLVHPMEVVQWEKGGCSPADARSCEFSCAIFAPRG